MAHLEREFTSAWVHRWRVWRARSQSMLEKFHISKWPTPKTGYRGSTALRGLSKLRLAVHLAPGVRNQLSWPDQRRANSAYVGESGRDGKSWNHQKNLSESLHTLAIF
jgi:hypothetical protein